jgi:hypothetical protein
MLIYYRKRNTTRKTGATIPPANLQIEFTAAHEKLTLRTGTNKAAFMVNQLGAAHRTTFPPFFLWRLWAGPLIRCGAHRAAGRQIDSRHKSFVLETPSSNKDFSTRFTWTSPFAHTIVAALGS